MIPLMRPTLPTSAAILPYLDEIQESRVYSNRGPLVRRLEDRYAEKVGIAKELVVLCANATLALQGIAHLSNSEEFVAPSFTFPATALAVIAAGKKLHLADIESSSWAIKPAPSARERQLGRILVLPFGEPVDLAPFADQSDLLIDAAAGLGTASHWVGQLQENWSAVFSLHATKAFGIGEGGLAVFGDTHTAKRFRAWLNFGFEGTRSSALLGTNAKLSEYAAAVGHAVVDDWEAEAAQWKAAGELVRQHSSHLSTVGIESRQPWLAPYWLAAFRSGEERDRVTRRLDAVGIETRLWWSDGCHRMPAFVGVPRDSMPVTEALTNRYLGLPFRRDLSADEVQTVVREIIEATEGP